MADYNRVLKAPSATADIYDAGLRAHMLRVYDYMLVALALTGGASLLVLSNPQIAMLFFKLAPTGQVAGLSALGWVALIAPFALVLFLQFRIQHMSVGAAQASFWGYAALMGVALTPTLWFYTGASIAQAFFVTAAMFGGMSLWGYTTKRDLTGMGSFLMMGLFGLIIAMFASWFFHSAMLQFAISVIGVIIFTGLTAYDTQKIKEMYVPNMDGTASGRGAIMGALRLYLDFLNLFLMLLRLMGDRR